MIKKIFSIFVACTTLFCLTACGSAETPSEKTDAPSQSDSVTEEISETSSSEILTQDNTDNTSALGETHEDENTSNALVVYFSVTGNTKTIAETLAKKQNTDIYEIVPEQPYTSEDLNYNDSSTRATVEQNDENTRPIISGNINDIENYDVVYIGYPIWWGDMPRILYTFFDIYDLSGKTIVPFCTSGGSGLSGTPLTISELEPNANVLDGLQISSSSLSNAESNINEWIASIGLSE